MIDLYTWPAPNGQKIHILMEELGIAYRVIPVDITAGAQNEQAFRAINPNGRIPAIVDHAPVDDGSPITVFESGAVMQYLADKEHRFLPDEARLRTGVLQWLYWQVGGLGPAMGQAQHFFNYAVERVPYGITRYQKETARLFKVLDDRLADRDFLSDAYSIADMACYPWIRVRKHTGVTLDAYPNLEAWYGRMRQRPAVGRGIALLRDKWIDVTKSAGAKENLFLGQARDG